MDRLVASPPRDAAMLPLPTRFAGLILAFAPLFVHHSWQHAQFLLIGAILTPGRRAVVSVLRIMGMAHERRFVNTHRILNRAAWCPRTGGRILFGLLIGAFAPHGPVVLGLDDTIERRRGKRIAAKGIYRDPVRSSDSHFVKASGLRWMSLMVLAPIPWASRVWALPFLTALVPSERACRERDRRHKPLLDVGRQLALQARRWLPGRDLVVVGDGASRPCCSSMPCAAPASRRSPACGSTQRSTIPPRRGRPARSDARAPRTHACPRSPRPSQPRTHSSTRWWCRAGTGRASASSRSPGTPQCGGTAACPSCRSALVLVRDPEARFPPQALLCTDPTREPAQIVGWSVAALERRGDLPGSARPSRR